MANEIVFRRIPGNDYFVTIRDIEDSYKVWEPTVGPAFETWGTGARSLDDYGIEASEAFGNGMFAVNMPAGINTAKRLLIEIYRQAGANPADDDAFDGSFELVWNGSAVVFVTTFIKKILANKAIQNKSTGVIQHYDDDGETVILTLTPTDGETEITRTPS